MKRSTKLKMSKAMKKSWATRKHKKSKVIAKKMSWLQFVSRKMSEYMQSEGNHANAMRRLSREWKLFKKS